MPKTGDKKTDAARQISALKQELQAKEESLQTKVADLSRVNNDMNNLLATGIATVFVDHELHILRFTPSATRIINLILSDVGRPVGHIVSNLVGYDSLVADTQTVLDTLIPKEVDVQTAEGRWYSMRIQPYRTQDNVIEGAVITFVDVTDVRKTQVVARRSQAMLHITQQVAKAGSWEWEAASQSLFWTQELYRIYGLKPGKPGPVEPEHLSRSLECYASEDRRVIENAFHQCVTHGTPYDVKLSLTTTGGRQQQVRSLGEPVMEKGKVTRAVGVIMEITRPGFHLQHLPAQACLR